jgi:hypothetical protein
MIFHRVTTPGFPARSCNPHHESTTTDSNLQQGYLYPVEHESIRYTVLEPRSNKFDHEDYHDEEFEEDDETSLDRSCDVTSTSPTSGV